MRVGAGENWHRFVEYCLHRGWHGLENLALIPGLVGAAPMQNIGAYGVELKDSMTSLEYLETGTGHLVELRNQDCQFGYRDSVFKHALAGKAVVTSITVALKRQFTPRIEYPALSAWFAEQAPEDAWAVFKAVCKIRNEKLPLPADLPNNGSFFKNPVVPESHYRALKQEYPDLVGFEMNGRYKLAAGWLIEQAGWKQREHQGVRVHQQQSLVIVNPECRPGRIVLEFAYQIQADIQNKYGMELEIEPRVY